MRKRRSSGRKPSALRCVQLIGHCPQLALDPNGMRFRKADENGIPILAYRLNVSGVDANRAAVAGAAKSRVHKMPLLWRRRL